MTDWIEDFLLRLKGHEVYDLWVAHYIPFDHPDMVEVAQLVIDLWSRDGFVLGGMENVADIPFADAGLPLLDGDCMMHRQSNFYASNFEAAGASIGPDGDVDVFQQEHRRQLVRGTPSLCASTLRTSCRVPSVRTASGRQP